MIERFSVSISRYLKKKKHSSKAFERKAAFISRIKRCTIQIYPHSISYSCCICARRFEIRSVFIKSYIYIFNIKYVLSNKNESVYDCFYFFGMRKKHTWVAIQNSKELTVKLQANFIDHGNHYFLFKLEKIPHWP